jgi:putative molybdopterin biosynthesis protein
VSATSPYRTTVEAAEFLRRSPRTLKQMAAAGQVPHRKLVGGTSPLLFLEAELVEWVDGGMELETIETPNGGRITRPKR